jgi:hypothetical protein
MLNTQALSVHAAPHTHTSSVSHQSDKQELSTRDEREHHIKPFQSQTLVICSSIDSSSGKFTKNSQEHQEQVNS